MKYRKHSIACLDSREQFDNIIEDINVQATRELELGIVRIIMTTAYEALNTSRCVHPQLFTLHSIQERRGAGYSWDPEQETNTI